MKEFDISSLYLDIREGLLHWRKWHLLGAQSIKSRYARSKLGQFWPALSFLVTVIVLGVVYAYLWNMPVHVYLPHVAISQTLWTLINTTVTDGSKAFIENESLIKTEYHPRSMFVLAMLTRQMTYFLHNSVVLVPLLFIFPIGFRPGMLVFILLGFVLVLANLFWMGFVIGLLSTRFRDLPNIIASIMQIVYFATPVMWIPGQLAGKKINMLLVQLNPFASLLAIVRDPFMGIVPDILQYAVVVSFMLAGYILLFLLFRRYNKRLVYWL